ncbi:MULTISPECIES: sensor histidine kinase [Streptomyces]|uniref:histidine kinase n=6 Tax=Streptomyces scabiei TaxID=1930 RepID=C9Z0Y0_STRSW|nr:MULTISPECIES: sensor histidine kinase [Streptomyces]MDX2537159.1 sensor domain-containing protein [Streptomyces scabiei]MDX2575532.1 sensor domain-containing protein [Streptomyces scabiei]MDX2652987.1 sensor domain-containing protein [Streptomyces scabiei]MDX2718744.1 sensor domain-containing protein [Streptomyces scabiei]MDX2797489.1 sensor domain-containing protein [Streptomyces scabiei]
MARETRYARLRERSARSAGAALYLATGLPTGLTWLVVCCTLLALGVATLPLAVGVVPLCAALLSGLPLGAAERLRLRLFTGERGGFGGATGLGKAVLPTGSGGGPARTPRTGGGPLAWVRQRLTERATWWEFGYAVLHGVLSLVEFLAVLAAVTLCGALLTAPLLRRLTHDGGLRVAVFRADTDAQACVLVLCGGVCLVLAHLVLTRYARVRARATVFLLGRRTPEPGAGEEQYIGRLVRSRARIMDAYDAERRRIERDLHDGAQQRLTGLIMTLGLARLAVADADAETRELVERAHEQAKVTLTELRDLVHGIFPAVLTDRGLPTALAVLAENSPLPVTVEVELPDRPAEAVEAATYFVACEALANVTKHSEATEARLSLRRTGPLLVLEVHDNGRGGADAEEGSGLLGLADRVAALEGTVHLSSPVGGPTLLHVEIPCAS